MQTCYIQPHTAYKASPHKHLHDLRNRARNMLVTFPIAIFTTWLHVNIERSPTELCQDPESFRTREHKT